MPIAPLGCSWGLKWLVSVRGGAARLFFRVCVGEGGMEWVACKVHSVPPVSPVH